MAAPDVVRGPDGRYYLYYNDNYQLHCRVAVSSRPEGPFQPYGLVQNPDGTPFVDFKMFDPGVLVDDDDQIYLFTGFSIPDSASEAIKKMKLMFPSHSMGFRLNRDMLTIEEGTVAGYKYFDFKGPCAIGLTLRGTGNVTVHAITDDPHSDPLAQTVSALTGDHWQTISMDLPNITGTHVLYFRFLTESPIQFRDFHFQTQ